MKKETAFTRSLKEIIDLSSETPYSLWMSVWSIQSTALYLPCLCASSSGLLQMEMDEQHPSKDGGQSSQRHIPVSSLSTCTRRHHSACRLSLWPQTIKGQQKLFKSMAILPPAFPESALSSLLPSTLPDLHSGQSHLKGELLHPWPVLKLSEWLPLSLWPKCELLVKA